MNTSRNTWSWSVSYPTLPGNYQARRDNNQVIAPAFDVRLVLENGELLLSQTYLRDRRPPTGLLWRGPLTEDGHDIDLSNSPPVQEVLQQAIGALVLKPTISYSDTQEPRVNARELHTFLGVGKAFGAWIAERIENVGFVEGVDFDVVGGLSVPNSESSKARSQKTKDYLLTLDMAKELSMLERNDKGKQARRYFIECEKRLRQRPTVPAIDFSDPLATAKLYVEAEEGKRLALAELSTTRLTLDTTTKQLGYAVIEKDEQVRKFDAIGRAVALEKESKILSGWLKEVSRITGVGPNRGLKILQAYGILCRKKVEGCSNTDEPGITTPYLDKEWLCYKLQPAVGKTITEDKIGDDGEVVIGANGKPEQVVVEVLDAAGDQVQVHSRTVKVTPKGCEHIMKLLSTCDETLLWRLISLVKVPELRALSGRYTFSEHHNFAHKMFPKSSDTVRRMVRFVKPTHPFEIWVAWIYAESTGPEQLVGRGNTLEQAYRELAKVVSAY